MCARRNPDKSSQSTHSVQCDFLPDPYCVLNDNEEVVQINQAGSKLFALERGDIEGKPVTDMLDTDSKERFQTYYPKIVAGERMPSLTLTLASTTGDSVIVSCNMNPEYDSQDQFVGAHCIFRDITAKKQRETELMRFRSLLDQSYDGILILDPNGFEIVDANDTICDWLGYTREELLSLHPWDIEATMSDPAVWPKSLERLREIKNKQHEGENRKKRWLDVSR